MRAGSELHHQAGGGFERERVVAITADAKDYAAAIAEAVVHANCTLRGQTIDTLIRMACGSDVDAVLITSANHAVEALRYDSASFRQLPRQLLIGVVSGRRVFPYTWPVPDIQSVRWWRLPDLARQGWLQNQYTGERVHFAIDPNLLRLCQLARSGDDGRELRNELEQL